MHTYCKLFDTDQTTTTMKSTQKIETKPGRILNALLLCLDKSAIYGERQTKSIL